MKGVKSLEGFIHVIIVKRLGLTHLKVISEDLVGRLTTEDRRKGRSQLFLMFDRFMDRVCTQFLLHSL